jgi:hypothetical protein
MNADPPQEGTMTGRADSTYRFDSKTRSHAKTLRRVVAIVSGCVLASALLSVGTASAASRGFKLHNNSSHKLQLETVHRVPAYVCPIPTRCVPTHYPMDFEGRPANGAIVLPGGTHNWELKYGFSLTGGVQYAANLWYKIGNNGGTVEYTIEVFNFANESSCRVTPATAGRCTAEGTKLTFHNR